MTTPCSGSSGFSSSGPPPNVPTRQKRVVVYSRMRDVATFPTPALYDIHFDEDLFNVVAMRLVAADVPFPSYLVARGKEAFAFSLGTVPSDPASPAIPAVNAKLAAGDYATPQDLADELTTVMNAAAAAAGSSAAFWVDHEARTDSFVVWSTATEFSMLFGGATSSSSPARVLGFGVDRDWPSTPYAVNPASSAVPVMPRVASFVAAPFRRGPTVPSTAVLSLNVPNSEVLISTNQSADRSFALLRPDRSTMAIDSSSILLSEKRWTPPLGRLGRLRIKFEDLDGAPYDFQNQDHCLELVFDVVGQPFLPPTFSPS